MEKGRPGRRLVHRDAGFLLLLGILVPAWWADVGLAANSSNPRTASAPAHKPELSGHESGEFTQVQDGRTPGKLGPRLARMWPGLDPDAPIAAWVFFGDKGAGGRRPAPEGILSERAARRRLKVRALGNLVDTTDLPLSETYVSVIAAHSQRIRQRSRWFNAVSVEATPAQLGRLLGLPFVREIELVGRARRGPEPPEALPDAGSTAAPPAASATPNLYDYGPALGQLQQIRVVDLHNLGYDGSGVLVAHFDTGYRLLEHEVFAQLELFAGWDFVDGDADPAPPISSPAHFGAHGISTLSILAGFKPGKLIGPAFGAAVALARTEDDGSETRRDEDNWVAAMEWADSLGADVISSSLGYREYDEPFQGWTWEDMDGNTTIVTRAADMAVARGIVVVNAAGNDGSLETPNTLVAPADGDSVISVGFVDAAGVLSPFSSYGPTVDGRTKPDVLAQGVRTWTAVATGTSAYGRGLGSSMACPLVAGVVALLLQAHPQATPIDIRDALRTTARRADSVDRYEGWGIIDALAAHQYLRSLGPGPSPYGSRLARRVPNPYPFALLPVREALPFMDRGRLWVSLGRGSAGFPSRGAVATADQELPPSGRATLHVYDVRGRLVRRVLAADWTPERGLAWDGRDDADQRVVSGVYFLRLRVDSATEPGEGFELGRKITVIR